MLEIKEEKAGAWGVWNGKERVMRFPRQAQAEQYVKQRSAGADDTTAVFASAVAPTPIKSRSSASAPKKK